MGHLLKSINPEAAAEMNAPAPIRSRRPDVGDLVIYHMRRGHGRQGKTRFPAIVQESREGDHGLTLTVIMEAGELINATLVEEIGPGKDDGHCWERPDGSHIADAFRNTIVALHERVAAAEAESRKMRELIVGDYDIPGVSIIHIMQDFETRLRLMAKENSSLREHLMSEAAQDGLTAAGKRKSRK